MKILCIFPGKLGDAIFFTPTIRYLKQEHPDAQITWVYGSPMMDDFVTHFLRLIDLPVDNYIPYRYGYEGDFLEWKKKDWQAEFPGYDLYCNATLCEAPRGMHLIRWIPIKGDIIKSDTPLSNPAFKMTTEAITQRPRILVHPWIPHPERNSKSLMFLRPRYGDFELISIGQKNESMVMGTLDGRGLPYQEYVNAIREAKLVIGVASSFVTMAASLGVPAIMVHTGTRPEHCGIGGWHPKAFDMVHPFVYDIDRTINELLGM